MLGAPEVRWQGALFTISRQTPRTLLYYLASLGKMIARGELLGLFWPEDSGPIAHLRLRETLNKLRKGLPAERLLFTKGELVSLDFEETYVDMVEFHELTSQVGRLPWKIPPGEPLPSEIFQKLLYAYQLWRSPNILAGAKFTSSPGLDIWFSNLVSYNESLYHRILERLADHETAAGNLETALNLARQALVNHEYEEELHVRVMRLLIQIGQTKEARTHFKEVQAKFQKELNWLPGPELMDLYHQVHSDTRPVTAKENTRWNVRSSLQVLFVGRQKYLQQLHQAYQKGKAIFLLGESGQGKTRLLQEFSNQLQPRPRLFLAQCRPTESNLPYQPFIDLFRQQAAHRDWQSLPRLWANQLLILFPELSTLRSDLSLLPETNPEQARSLLFEALRQLCLVLTKSQNMLLILDDSQWIDEASLSAITYLINRPPFDRSAHLIISARLEDRNTHLEKAQVALKESNKTSLIYLLRMNLNEIDDLTHQVIGKSPPPEFVERLAQDTGGNPLFILETLHALIRQHPNPDLQGLGILPLAENVYSLIQNRVLSLPQRSLRVLEIAALIGNEFQPGTITKSSGLTEEEVALALEELESRLLISRSEVKEGPLRYRFIHDKFREALLLKISPMRAQIAHRNIAFALLTEEKEQATNQAAILAQHFEAAREWLLAYQQWIRAAQHAHRLYAVTEANQSFRNAEKLIEPCNDSLDVQQIYELYREWGEMAYASNDTPVLQAMNTNLMRLGERLQNPLLKGLALLRLGNACFSSGRLEEGLEYTRLAIDQLAKTDNLYQLISAKASSGMFLYMTGRVSEAIQIFEASLPLIKDTQDRGLIFQRAGIYYEMGMSTFLNGWLEKSQERFMQSLQDYRLLNNLDGITTAYSGLTLVSYFMSDYPQAFRYSQEGIEAARQSQSWRMLGYLYTYRAMLELATGNLDTMLEYVDRALELGHRIGQPDIYSTGYRIISDAFYFMDDFEKCLENLQIAAADLHKSFVALDTLYRLKAVRFIVENNHEELLDLQKMINQLDASGFFTGKLLAQSALAFAYRKLGNWESTLELTREIKKTALARKFRSVVAGSNLMLAGGEWQAGNHTDALRSLNESIHEAESIPFIWLELNARLLLFRFDQQSNQRSGANRQKIRQLLQIIHSNCQKSLFQPALQSYTQKIEQLIA